MRTVTPTLISTPDLVAALDVCDLTDPATGPHAVQFLLDDVIGALADAWGCAVDVQRRHPLVAVEDNYDRLGYDLGDITRDSRYTRYVGETVMLRSHTSAGVPPALRCLAREGAQGDDHLGGRLRDVLLVLPGLCYRRDSIDRLHVGTPHQVDLWRIAPTPLDEAELDEMIALVVAAVLSGAEWRTQPARHPYTRLGRQVDIHTDDGWIELAECGLAAPHVLAGAGLDPTRWNGLALGMGLDRAVMLRKGLPDIRLLRSTEPRLAAQMRDLTPWRPVSTQPAVRRDLSIVVDTPVDGQLLGDAVRDALGSDADDLETVTVVAATPYEQLPPPVRARIGLRPDQANVLLRLVLRPLGSTLTDEHANELRDRVYAAIHQGPRTEWATPRGTDGWRSDTLPGESILLRGQHPEP